LTNEYYLFLSIDATKLVSNKCLATGKIFRAKLVTIATAELVDLTFYSFYFKTLLGSPFFLL